MSARLWIWGALSLALTAAPREAAADSADLRATAWDRSVALEQEGKIDEARRLLLDAWGPTSESYEVTVRIAWLSLQLREAEAAVSAYSRARTLAGAGEEARQGLSSALTLVGYRHLDRAEFDEAQRAFEQALAERPDHPDAQKGLWLVSRRPILAPEVWGGYLHRAGGGERSRGWLLTASLPWQITREVRLRASFRHAEMATSGLSTTGWHQNDLFVDVGYEGRWFGGTLVGAALLPSQEDAVALAGARLRVGKWFGGQVEGSVFHREVGWSGQVLPTLYVHPIKALGLAGGARITGDPYGTVVSGYAGMSAFLGPVALSLSGHVGPERWPVTLSTPMVFSAGEELRLGGKLTALFSVSESWRLGLDAQVERFESSAGTKGIYVNVSAGAQFAPRW